MDLVPKMKCDRIWNHARLLTMINPSSVENGLIACRDGRIIYAGSASEAPAFDAPDIINCEGRWITPGLIDCHTHMVYAGNRAEEFEQRLAGVSYEAIARGGGGIISTMTATRAASDAELTAASLPRLDALMSEGVTTVEIKSGYGLSLDAEMKMLRVARGLADKRAVEITTTFLGAHAVPPEYFGCADDYIELVCSVMIPEIANAGLADSVDGFCEHIGFTPEQIERVFAAAKNYGLQVKLHAEQLSNSHGAALAARYKALSADHLEYLDDSGISAMAEAGTVAVVLPGAYYFTRETQPPPITKLRAKGIPMAIATDCNPGTSPLTSILLAMNMAATLFRMTIDECLAGVTRCAAQALGMQNKIGSLAVGKYCDLSIWNIERPAELVYQMGHNPLHARIWKGL